MLMNNEKLHRKTFLALLVLITIAFVWVLLPFYGAVFWGVILAMLFAPLQRRLLRWMPRRRTRVALITLALCLVIVILPTGLVAASLAQEIALQYQKIRSGELNFGVRFQQVFAVLPQWAVNLLNQFGLGDFNALQARLASLAGQASQFVAGQVIDFGQGTFDFLVSLGVMLYLLFFLLRDGSMLAARISQALPLDDDHKRALLGKFATVTRATVKGNVVVAGVQGLIGGVTFWALGIQGALLWGVLMAVLSLLPAVGAALIWAPVAVYFLAVGEVGHGLILIGVGVFVIGLVDNLLRPLLVGKDTQMPDYLVLVSTLGGIALVGINGFVIGPVVAALFIAAWDLFAAREEMLPPAIPSDPGRLGDAIPAVPPPPVSLPR